MEDSNANWGDGTVVLILKTAQGWEFSSGTSRRVKQPQALEFGLKFIWNFQSCSLAGAVWEVSPHWLAVKRILVVMAPLGCLSLSIPWHMVARSLSRTSSRSAESFDQQVRFWIRWQVSSMAGVSSHCLRVYKVPRAFIVGQNWTLVVPNVWSTTRRLPVCKESLMADIPCLWIQSHIQDCNKNHVCHISSGPCLKLKTCSFKSQITNGRFYLLPSTT